MKPLVIVRPQPGASATAEAARRMGLDPVVIPLFAVRPLEWEPPNPREFDALQFTSANSIRNGGPDLDRFRALPAYCVGEATAAAAREYGFDVGKTGEGRVDGLLQSLSEDLRLLHLCGFHRRAPKAARQAIMVVPVYSAEEIPEPDGLADFEGSVIALHSPRAGSRVARLVADLGLRREGIALAAISPEAAESAGSGWGAVESADQPNDAALLAIAAELCKNPR
jgi:uroporphyrinogen-III synthase